MRPTRILSICCHVWEHDLKGAKRIEQNRRMMLELLDQAASYRPDFVVFPELALHGGVGNFKEMVALAEPVPGPTFQAVAEKARRLRIHVLLPMYERKDDKVYNSAVLIGRDGEAVGTYRKYHATGYEIEDGVQPGDEIPVWDTDCGRVGCMICFDLEYYDVPIALARQDARLVFWPTMYDGGVLLSAWAAAFGFYMVRSYTAGGCVVDMTGRVLAGPGPYMYPNVAGAKTQLLLTFGEVNLDRKSYHPDFNREKMYAAVAKYAGGVDLTRADEGRLILACNMPDKTVEDLEKEFALTPLQDYLDQASHIRQSRLK